MDVFSYTLNEKDILVYRSVFTPVNSNMFAIINNDDQAVVFDPNVDDELLRLFEKRNVNFAHIILTHEHYDHTSGVNWLSEHIKTDVYCQEECATIIANEKMTNPAMVAFKLAEADRKDGGHRYRDFKLSYKPYSIKAGKTFGTRDILRIGELEIKATSTPGHCPGAACYELLAGMVFTGDTLLQCDPTITRFPESNKEDYENIALPYLRSLPKDTIIMPGHGDPFVLNDTNNI